MLKSQHYEINRQNLMAHELSGLEVNVVGSSDANKQGIRGKIINETKNMFEIETKIGVKDIPKKEAKFEFKLGGEKVIVAGEKLVARPEDRVKGFWRKSHGRM